MEIREFLKLKKSEKIIFSASSSKKNEILINITKASGSEESVKYSKNSEEMR
ncbi:MAG: hypothetical protein PHU63_00785 [Candidatus ainarchaeum sp.]|nr:hypothetical protein [Candidatus ainarchaeum sp.]